MDTANKVSRNSMPDGINIPTCWRGRTPCAHNPLARSRTFATNSSYVRVPEGKEIANFAGSRSQEFSSMSPSVVTEIRIRARSSPPLSIVIRLQSVLGRSEEHTSELQSLMRISYAVFCLKKKKQIKTSNHY